MNLELANKRLQGRLTEQGEKNDSLARELSSATQSIKSLNEEVRSLKKKLHISEKDNNRLRSTRPSTDKVTVVTTKSPLKDKNVTKVVNKILSNRSKYNLSPPDLRFLKSIRNLNTLSEKQNSWLTGINLRGKGYTKW